MVAVGCGTSEQPREASSSAKSRLCVTRDCVPGNGGNVGNAAAVEATERVAERRDCVGATGTLTVSSTSVFYGRNVTVTWAVSRPAACLDKITLLGSVVAKSGTMTFAVKSDTALELKIGGRLLASAHVTVDLPMVVRINGSTPEWRDLMIFALGMPGRTVILADHVDMDLTGQENIFIRENVTFTSELPDPGNVLYSLAVPGADTRLYRGPARTPSRPGPRLYTNSRPKPLFEIRCNNENIFGDNVHINGFRIQGPHPHTMEGEDNLETGIQITSCVGVDISNMELSGFSGQAIYIVDDLGRQNDFEQIHIHDNYIHNNQHRGGNGYGVNTADGSRALIERNVFDYNRHAIASSGAAETGYHARRNLVLKGGGHHDTWYNEYTHQFDVHGDDNCAYGLSDSAWNCGNAGDTYIITDNAFQYMHDNDIKIRGKPRGSVTISNNFFPFYDIDDAVNLYTTTNVSVFSNTLESFSDYKYGVCDFDGDGRDDLFLATGASWWWSSAGLYPWSFLSTNSETLNQVGLGDFNGDGRCDVFAVNAFANTWEISSGGSGPWTALPGSYSIPFGELAFGDFNGDKRTDIFRRAPDTQWWAISPGVYDWTPLQSSGLALTELHLGDFDGNGITDVLARSGGNWKISWDARSSWDPVPGHDEDLKDMMIANVDGIPGDDVVRYRVPLPINGIWEMASGARGSWTFMTARAWSPLPPWPALRPAQTMKWTLGHFNGLSTASLLEIDLTRRSKIYTQGYALNTAYSTFAY